LIKRAAQNSHVIIPKLRSLDRAGLFLTKVLSGMAVLGLDRRLKKSTQLDVNL
jgi:hypothetical protein